MSAYPSHTRIFVRPITPPPPPATPAPTHYDYAAAVEAKRRDAKRAVPFLAAIYAGTLVVVAIQGDWLRVVVALLPASIALGAVVARKWRSAGYSVSGYAMNGWFSPKRAVTDAVIAGTMSLFMLFWFGQVLGVSGSLALIGAMFGVFQLLRFMNAQLATLEWARLQESGRDEKKPVVAMPRGDGYRDVAERAEDPEPDADLYEKELPRRRRSARIAVGVVGAVAAALALLPGIAFGAWTFPAIIGVLSLTMIAFRFGMRAMQRGEARPLAAPAPPRVRVGVDFGVPQTQLASADADDDDDEPEEAATPRRALNHRA